MKTAHWYFSSKGPWIGLGGRGRNLLEGQRFSLHGDGRVSRRSWGVGLLCSLALVGAVGCGGSLAESQQATSGEELRSEERLVKEPVFGYQVLVREAGRAHRHTVVLVHGVGSLGSRIWDRTIPLLAKHYHVIAIDMPGFGRSEKGNALYSPERLAAFVRWVITRFGRGRVALVGHSLGGAVSLYVAARYPELVDRLILVDVAGILHRLALTEFLASLRPGSKWGKQITDVFEHPLGLIQGVFGQTLLTIEGRRMPRTLDALLHSAAFRRAALESDANRIAGLALLLTEYTELFSQVTADTTILWGKRDIVAPPRTGRLLAYRIPGAGLRLIPQAGHSPMLETPGVFHQLLSEALKTPGSTPPLHLIAPAQSSAVDGSPAEPFISSRPPTERSTAHRLGRCRNDQGQVFTGRFLRIEIHNCTRVRLQGVTADEVKVMKSNRVVINQSRIAGGKVALYAEDSGIELTAVDLEGEVALHSKNSKLDLAGVHLDGVRRALRVDGSSSLLFSVSRYREQDRSGNLHGLYANIRKR